MKMFDQQHGLVIQLTVDSGMPRRVWVARCANDDFHLIEMLHHIPDQGIYQRRDLGFGTR